VRREEAKKGKKYRLQRYSFLAKSYVQSQRYHAQQVGKGRLPTLLVGTLNSTIIWKII
jgi:hypothetical protein